MKKIILSFTLICILFIGITNAQKDTTKTWTDDVFKELDENLMKLDKEFSSKFKKENDKGFKKNDKQNSKNKVVENKTNPKIEDFNHKSTIGAENSNNEENSTHNRDSNIIDFNTFVSSDKENKNVGKDYKNKHLQRTEYSPFIKRQKRTYRNRRNGFYVGVDTRFINPGNTPSTGVNGRIGFIKNHFYSFGAEAGTYNRLNYFNKYLQKRINENWSYGGASFEITLFSKLGVHLNFPVSVGMGSASISSIEKYNFPPYADNVYYNEYQGSYDFVYAQAGAQVEINLLKWMRLGIGVNGFYRSQTETPYIMEQWKSEPIGTMSLKIGLF